MNKEKLLYAFGLAQRGNKLVVGVKLLQIISTNKVQIVFLASDMGATQQKKIINKCLFYNVKYITDYFTTAELSVATGKKKVVAFGITDPNVLKLITQYL